MARSLSLVFSLAFLSIFPFGVKCTLRGHRNLSCIVCHHNSDVEAPESKRACLDRNEVKPADLRPGKLLERRMLIMDRCALCSIEDMWDLTTKKYAGDRIKKCIVTNTTGAGCTYHYPAGQSDIVVETCRCNTNLCNLQGITSIGGKDDLNQFPERSPFIQDINSANRKFSRKFIVMLIIAILKIW